MRTYRSSPGPSHEMNLETKDPGTAPAPCPAAGASHTRVGFVELLTAAEEFGSAEARQQHGAL